MQTGHKSVSPGNRGRTHNDNDRRRVPTAVRRVRETEPGVPAIIASRRLRVRLKHG